MSYRDDCDYYWIRAAEELERAGQAASPTVAAVHYDLARRYGKLAAKTDSGSPEASPAEEAAPAEPGAPATGRAHAGDLRSVGSRQLARAGAGRD